MSAGQSFKTTIDKPSYWACVGNDGVVFLAGSALGTLPFILWVWSTVSIGAALWSAAALTFLGGLWTLIAWVPVRRWLIARDIHEFSATLLLLALSGGALGLAYGLVEFLMTGWPAILFFFVGLYGVIAGAVAAVLLRAREMRRGWRAQLSSEDIN